MDSEQTGTSMEGSTMRSTSKKSKKNIIIAIIIVVILIAAAYLMKGYLIAATVNGSMISRASVVKALEIQGGKQVLDSLITEKLIKAELEKKGITLTDAEVDAEVKNIEASITAQGGKLDEALAGQGMTLNDLKNKIALQKKLEKLFADKITVSNEEVDAYIKTNKIDLPKGKEAEVKDQIKAQIRQQKLNQEAQTWITGLKSAAKIKYYGNY